MRKLLPRLGLVGRFSVLSLLVIAALGVGLAKQRENGIAKKARAEAVRTAQLLAWIGVQPNLSANEVRRRRVDEQTRRSIDYALYAGRVSDEIVEAKVWSPDRRVVYSSDPTIVGQRFPASDGLREALGGRTHAEFDQTDKEAENSGRLNNRRLVEVYVPLRFANAGPAAGAFEIYMPYAPIAASIRRETQEVYLLLLGGLGFLWAVLFRIVAGASRKLRRQAAENRHQAMHDGLTGLPNRLLFMDRARQAIRSARRERSEVGVMLIDLDGFKEINDTLGHHCGDVLLREIGPRLRESLREVDTVARLGGDEFAVLLPGVRNTDGAIRVAAKIRSALEQPYTIEGIALDVTASIGIALYAEHGADVETLMQRADVAMYVAKEDRTGHAVYLPENDPYSPDRLALVGELRRGIEEGELTVHYQPKVDLATGAACGVEALVRWEHPQRGLMPPDFFLPVAERTGLMQPLTARVLDLALAQCREWRDEGLDLTVAVNLSTRSLLDTGFPSLVAMLLDRHGVPPSRLELEVTEDSIMADPTHVIGLLGELDAMGITVSIDEFGTGHSSLSRLNRMPVGEIKIDKGFVLAMDANENDAVIVRSTIDLGRNLGLRVVAEGVESELVLERLTELGCHMAQGYHLSKPLPGRELTGWLHEHASAEGTARPRVSAH